MILYCSHTGEQVMGAIIADLDKLSDTLGEAQLLELVED